MNLGKFQEKYLTNAKVNHTNQIINVDLKEIKAVSKVKLLEILIDDKLNFNHHTVGMPKTHTTL